MIRYTFVTTPKEGFSYDGAVKPRVDFSRFAEFRLGSEVIPLSMYTGKPDFEGNTLATDSLSEMDIVIYQTPTYTTLENELDFIKKAHKKGAIVVGMVHDIDFLRFGGDPTDTIKNLSAFDHIVLPSDEMYQAITKRGKLQPSYSLQQGPWDYSVDCETNLNRDPLTNFSRDVNYAGNLNENKSGFLKSLIGMGVRVNIFGQVEDWMSILPKDTIKGPKDPSTSLIKEMNKGFGLVWSDGPQNEASYHSYEDYNWQYKVSAYIAAGIVPIVRSGTNVGKWVEKHNIGVVIDELDELPGILSGMSLITYNSYLAAARLTRGKIISGSYTASTILEILTWVRSVYG